MVLLLVFFMALPPRISSVSITVPGENGVRFGFNDSVVGFAIQTPGWGTRSRTPSIRYSHPCRASPSSGRDVHGLGSFVKRPQPSPGDPDREHEFGSRHHFGLSVEFTGRWVGLFLLSNTHFNVSVEFTMSVQHDRPGVGDDFSKQIQTTIHLASAVMNESVASNGNGTDVTLTVYTTDMWYPIHR